MRRCIMRMRGRIDFRNDSVILPSTIRSSRRCFTNPFIIFSPLCQSLSFRFAFRDES